MPEALGVLEIETIHQGLGTIDGMAKTAPVTILTASPIPPGRFLIVIGGPVGEVESSFKKGIEIAGESLHDRLFLAEVAPGVLRAIRKGGRPDHGPEAHRAGGASDGPGDRQIDALGLFETGSVSSCLDSADKGLKGAEVALHHLHLARGIQGKCFALFSGRQDMVEAALEISEIRARAHQAWIGATLLARPDEAVAARITAAPWGFLEGQEIL